MANDTITASNAVNVMDGGAGNDTFRFLSAADAQGDTILGFQPGEDYKLADTTQIFGYFKKLAAASDRIRFVEFGKSSLGKPTYSSR